MSRQWPDDWKRPLGDTKVCKIIMGQSPPSHTYNTEGKGLPFFQGKADFGDLYPTPRKWCTSPQKIALPGDVLISVRAPVGPTNLVAETCAIGRGLAALRPGRLVVPKYLLYALRSIEKKIADLGTGSTFPAITKTQLASIEIPIPYPDDPDRSLAEQRRIVARLEVMLGEVQAVRAEIRAMQEGLDRLMEAVLEGVFPPYSRSCQIDGNRVERLHQLVSNGGRNGWARMGYSLNLGGCAFGRSRLRGHLADFARRASGCSVQLLGP